MAGDVRNSNKVSWWNILTADDVHMLAGLSVAVEAVAQKVTLSGSFKMTTTSNVAHLKLHVSIVRVEILQNVFNWI